MAESSPTPCDKSGSRPKGRPDKLYGEFMRQRYGLSLRDLKSKLRAPMLDDVETVPCNLCGGEDSVPVAESDKYGLAVTTAMCRRCGLMYLNPRPTVASYDRFYTEGGSEEGVYHVSLGINNIGGLLKRYYGAAFVLTNEDKDALRAFVLEKYSEVDGGEAPDDSQAISTLEERARAFQDARYGSYADDLFEYLKPHVPRGGKVFETGASWGKLLEPWRERHGCEVTGLEPRAATVQEAMDRLGIKLFQGFPATAAIPENTYDVVMNIRTINHMLDPLGDLRHAWRWLKPGGILFVDISDAIREARYEGFENNVVEIDHTYMFSVNTLSALVEKAGFVVERKDIVDTRHVLHGDAPEPEFKQIRIVARKSEQEVEVHWPDPMQELAALLQGELHRDRALHADLLAARNGLKSAKVKGKRDGKRKKAEAAAEPEPAVAPWFGLRGLVAASMRRRPQPKD